MKIRNGDTPIQLPEIVKAGDEITAKWANGIRKALQQLRDRKPVGYKGNGKSSTSKAPFIPSLKKEQVEGGGFVYTISVTDGYVIERKIGGESAIIYHTPTGIKDGAGDPVWHEIADGECLYVKLQVDNRGVLTGEPTVEVAEDDLAGEHSRPEVFDFDGNEGEHNYKICKFEIVDDKPKLKLFSAGDNIDHFTERVGMRNLDGDGGTNYALGKDYDDSGDTVGFRSLMQLAGEGAAIIKPYGEGGAGNTVDFRTISQRETQAQIIVEAEGDSSTILIKGNDVNGENPYMVVVDGLVTEVKSEGSTPDGIDFQLTFYTGDASDTLVLKWEKGALISAKYNSVDADSGGVASEAVDGG
jgi:hypothetical protein